MPKQTSVDRFSSVADFELLANGQSYAVVQVASDFLILESPQQIPPGEAELIIRVDGEVIHRQITLPEGANPNVGRVPILRH
jgi:hypothetical protein